MEKNNDATLEELCELLEVATGVKVGKSTIVLDNSKVQLQSQKKTLYAPEKENVELQHKRVEYWQIVTGIKAENLVFIDESGVNLAMLRLYARALKGQRAFLRKTSKTRAKYFNYRSYILRKSFGFFKY